MKTVYPHPRITTSSHHHIITSPHHHITTSSHHHITTLAFSFFIFSSLFSFAQTPTWKNITPPGWSGTFKQVVYSTTNGLVALADNGYLYASKDTAQTWTPYQTPDTAMIAITMYPDNTTGFIQNEKSVYKTKDGLKTWTKLPLTGISSDMQIRTVWIKNADTVLLVATNLENGLRIFLSKDTAKTWTQVAQNILNSATYITIYGFYFPTPMIGYGYGYDCYVSTADGGKTWVNHPIPYSEEEDNAYRKTYSYPNGKTLIFMDSNILLSPDGNPSSATQVGSLSEFANSVCGFGATVYALDWSGAFNYSIDSGATWKSKVILDQNTNTTISGMYFFNPSVGVIVTSSLTSMVTTDSGKTWTKYVHGGAEGFNTIYCKTSNECFITGNTGRLFHTANGGTTWDYQDLFNTTLQQVVFPTPDTGYVSAGNAIFRTIDTTANSERIWTKFTYDVGGGWLSFPTKDTGYVGYSSGYFDKTTDAGATWTDFWEQTGGSGGAFRSANEGLFSGSNNLLYTNDGGITWKVKATGIVASEIITTNDYGWVLLSLFDSTVNSLQQRFVRMYKCDKNINCKQTITVGNGAGLKRVNDSTLCFESGDSIYFSRDYGNTWKSQLYWAGAYDLCFPISQIAYSIGLNTIYKAWFASNLSIGNIKVVDKTLTVTVTSISDATSINTSINVLNNKGTIVYNLTQVIDNGVPLSITLPETITTGTYSLEIIPTDTSLYSKVQSQTFSITATGLNMVETDNNLIARVIGNTINCNCQSPYEIYNTLGQRMQKNAELPIGVYIVRCNNIVQKVIIKP